jgi:hypothetical protein
LIKKPSWDPRVISGARFLAKSGDDVGDGECHPLVFAAMAASSGGAARGRISTERPSWVPLDAMPPPIEAGS